MPNVVKSVVPGCLIKLLKKRKKKDNGGYRRNAVQYCCRTVYGEVRSSPSPEKNRQKWQVAEIKVCCISFLSDGHRISRGRLLLVGPIREAVLGPDRRVVDAWMLISYLLATYLIV